LNRHNLRGSLGLLLHLLWGLYFLRGLQRLRILLLEIVSFSERGPCFLVCLLLGLKFLKSYVVRDKNHAIQN